MRVWVACFRFHGLLAAAAPPADPPRPTILLREGRVWDACPQALAAGVRPGQPAATARALCPLARRLPAEAVPPEVLARAWDILAQASSAVEPDGAGRPEALAAWPAGPTPLPALRAVLAATAAWRGVEVAVGLAPGRLLARLACPDPAGGQPGPRLRVVPPGEARRFLAAQPVEALVAEGLLRPGLARRLADLGLLRVGDVARVPSSVLRARWGREGEALARAVRGDGDAPVRALYPPRTVAVRQAYSEGLPPTQLPAAAEALARTAAGRLGPQEGAARLVLRAEAGSWARRWPSPRRSPGLLGRAAASLGRRAAEGGVAEIGWLEVVLEDLALVPLRAEPLWGPPEAAGRRAAVDRLLERLPPRLLRRGAGAPSRYETLLAQLDPWWSDPTR